MVGVSTRPELLQGNFGLLILRTLRYLIAIERYLGAALRNRAATWLDYTSPRVSAAHAPIDKVLNSSLSSGSGRFALKPTLVVDL